MKTVLSVMGTRPEVIKMAPVVKALAASDQFTSLVCASSQHRTMQDQMLQLFDIQPDFDLDIMRPGQDLYYVTQAALTGLKKVLEEAKPDLVLVQGDTTTCFVGALAAFYAGIPVGHVEAGLRTYDLTAPFPEEANRQLASRIVQWHFAPTTLAASHLASEGIAAEAITVTGNTVIDALLWVQSRLNADTLTSYFTPAVWDIVHAGGPYVLITGHRRENFGQGFESICQAIATCAKRYPDWQFIYPVHLNPAVQEPVFRILRDCPNIHLIDPVPYEPFVYLMQQAQIILTDSGGVQEEAPTLGKPVLVMRETTERPEGVDAGTAKLVGTDTVAITTAVQNLIEDATAYQAMANAVNPYGDGTAAQRIEGFLAEKFDMSTAAAPEGHAKRRGQPSTQLLG